MTKLIAEIGINHLGDASKLTRMIELSAKTGLRFLKFQYRSNDKYFFHHDLEMGSTLVAQQLESANLGKNIILNACLRSRALGMAAGVSFFRTIDLHDFCADLVPDFIKIPSAESMNFDLINAAKGYEVPLIVSTGGLTLAQLDELASQVTFSTQDCVMYCVANYPAALGATYPSMISAYRTLFGCQVGYSSHDQDWEINIAYLQAGVDMLERHLCENKKDIGLDVSTSSDFDEMMRLQMFCDNSTWRQVKALSDKAPNQGEIQNLKDLGSGYYYDQNYTADSFVPIAKLTVKSPCRGVRVGSITDFKITHNVMKGSPVVEDDLRPNQAAAVILDFDKLSSRRISLPVRFHDYCKIIDKFDLRNFEFHMSFQDVSRIGELKETLLAKLSPEQEFSIHLPDYISSSALIDPFSKDIQIKSSSCKIIKECVAFAHFFEDFTSKRCPIVGSFSVIDSHSRTDFYNAYRDLLGEILERDRVAIMPQFLPKKAWYFGGSCELNVFCSINDIEFYREMPSGICLDTAHCIMAANSAGASTSKWINEMLPLAGHIHVSDAQYEDGEGVIFGSGDLVEEDIQTVLAQPVVKVVEQWEGHLRNFKGFELALKYLEEQIA